MINNLNSLQTWASKLKRAIDRHLESDTIRKQAGTKGVITRLVNERSAVLGSNQALSRIEGIIRYLE